MEKKSLLILVLITVFSFVLLTPQAQAGPEERYRWEGIAIGVGAAIIGSAILNSHQQSRPVKVVAYHQPPKSEFRHRSFHRKPVPRSHWEIRKEWVPPTYKRVWNPAHYNQRGEWIEGRWIEIEDQPGYWVEKKVWVTCR